MKRAKYKDMTRYEKREYKYYSRLLIDLSVISVPRMKEIAEKYIQDIDEKYTKEVE
ncbi:hypothetical protein [Globicatella sanguinis]